MKTELKVKLLQHLSGKKKEQGFTLIELLVVIIIIGILSAIALPSFLNQSAKARASEARTNVGAMNRSQQAFYLERQQFAEGDDAIKDLGIGIKDSNNYEFKAESESPSTSVINWGRSKKKDLKGHVGGVFSSGGQTPSVLCEANEAGAQVGEEDEYAMTAPALAEDGTATCNAASTKQVGG